jgi:hypothetical protein
MYACGLSGVASLATCVRGWKRCCCCNDPAKLPPNTPPASPPWNEGTSNKNANTSDEREKAASGFEREKRAMDLYSGIRARFQQRLHVAARSAAAEGEREEHAAASSARLLEHHHLESLLPQIGKLLHRHLLCRRGLRAADLVLPEPRRQQRGLVVVRSPELLLHPLRLLPGALRCFAAAGGSGQVGPAGGLRQDAEHLVEELVVYPAGAGDRAEVVKGYLAGGGHGLHLPRRGLHRSPLRSLQAVRTDDC